MAARQRDESRLRILLTQECARIMVESGVKDFLTAKRKAASRFGVSNKNLLPTNREIEAAVADYQRLFKSDEQNERLNRLRETALQAMQFLTQFQPRLVGSVLNGTAGVSADVTLHLFSDTAEEVMMFLMEHNIPFETAEKRLRLVQGDYAYYPQFTFAAGETGVELIVFPTVEQREAPRSPVDGKPMQRAGLAEVRQLLEQ